MSVSTGSDSLDRIDLSDYRIPYNSKDVRRDFSEKDPFKLYDKWYTFACSVDEIKEPNAMALATTDLSGRPSVRYVSLKGYDKDGFHFCTSHESRKGKEISENPNVSLLFYWYPLHQQIRIEGTTVRLGEKESEVYFHARPRSVQISALVSHQSTVVESAEVLSEMHLDLEKKFGDEIIPKPSYWGGYKVIPKSFEFWCGQGHTSKLHDRLRFRLPAPQEVPDNKLSFAGENGWIYEYLSP